MAVQHTLQLNALLRTLAANGLTVTEKRDSSRIQVYVHDPATGECFAIAADPGDELTVARQLTEMIAEQLSHSDHA